MPRMTAKEEHPGLLGSCVNCGGKLRRCMCGHSSCSHPVKHVSNDSVQCDGGLPE